MKTSSSAALDGGHSNPKLSGCHKAGRQLYVAVRTSAAWCCGLAPLAKVWSLWALKKGQSCRKCVGIWSDCVQAQSAESVRRSSLMWLLFAGCLTSQQHASVSQGRICSDNLTCCHTEIEVADPTPHLTQSQHTDTGPTSPAMTLYRQAPGRVATGVPICKSLV